MAVPPSQKSSGDHLLKRGWAVLMAFRTSQYSCASVQNNILPIVFPYFTPKLYSLAYSDHPLCRINHGNWWTELNIKIFQSWDSGEVTCQSSYQLYSHCTPSVYTSVKESQVVYSALCRLQVWWLAASEISESSHLAWFDEDSSARNP
jgi:hypothetical protein